MPTMDKSGKSTLRRELLAARRALGADVRAAEARALARHLDEWRVTAPVACAYVPIGGEPGSPAMLDGLRRRGVRVLLPVVPPAGDGAAGPLLWGEYSAGNLVTGRFGLLEPPPPWLPATAVAEAGLILVPALAVDRRGMRLGRGAGCYDRSLPLRDPNAQLIAVVRDAELVDELPSEPHDVPMTHALTPGRGVQPLGRRCPE